MTEKKPKTRKGRPPKHGGYSLLVRAGELPENRKHIRSYLSAARIGLVRDLGPTEQDLTAAQVILIDRVICKLGVLRCIEEYIRETGVMKGQDVAPALQASYGSYSSSLRLDLTALGIRTRAGEGVLDLGAYIKAKDAEKSEKQTGKAGRKARQGQAEAEGPGRAAEASPEIVQPGASSEDIFGRGEGEGQIEQLRAEITALEIRKKQLEAGPGGPGEGEQT